jgi:Tol biopolymer transport system component
MPRHTVEVKLPDYSSGTRDLTYLEAVNGRSSEPIVVPFHLDLLKKDFVVDIVSTEIGSSIQINGQDAGVTPLHQTFSFTRASGADPWSTFLVVIKKDGFTAGVAPGMPDTGEAQPYVKTLTYDEAAKGKINAELVPVMFVRSPIAEIVPTSHGMTIVQKNVLSQVGEIEREPKVGGATKMTDFPSEHATHETRISLTPDGQHFVFSFPYSGQQNNNKTNSYFNLWMRSGGQQTRLTDAQQMDMDACISPDGQWIYFSSDRLLPGKQNIWRMQAAGRGGLTKITDSPSSKIDTEPDVSPDGKRLAFTSYLEGADFPQIWTANSDGTLPTQIRNGKSPNWSPDGLHIAFVAADNSGHDKIWIMGEDGSNPTQVTSGDSTDNYPVWTPDGKRIIYASDQALNEAGQRNFDIWIMNSDGTQNTQLTVNGSYDTRPAVSRDGKYVYFNSNRGASRADEPALQIWRIELPQ